MGPGINSDSLAASRESWCRMMLIWEYQFSRAPCAHVKYVVLCRMAFLCGGILVSDPSPWLLLSTEQSVLPDPHRVCPLPYLRTLSKKEPPSVLGCFSSGVGT